MSFESLKRESTPSRHTFLVLGNLLLAGLVILGTERTSGQQSKATEPPLTQESSVSEFERLRAEMVKLQGSGKTQEALSIGKKLLLLDSERSAEPNETRAQLLESIGRLYLQQDDFESARSRLNEVVSIREKLHPPQDWRSRESRRRLADVAIWEKLSQRERRSLRAAEVANQIQLRRVVSVGAVAAERLLEMRRRLLGEQHPDYATSLNELAGYANGKGDQARAERICREALEVRKRALGDQHPEYAESLCTLAEIYFATAQYRDGERFIRQSLEINKHALGEEHPTFAHDLVTLFKLLTMQGQFSRAEPVLLQAVEIEKKVRGENHFDYADVLLNLADLYLLKGEFARAEPLYRRALDIGRHTVGSMDAHCANCLVGLGKVYKTMADYPRAEPLLRQATVIYKMALGEQSANYLRALIELATVYLYMGDYARAEPLFRKCLESQDAAHSENGSVYAYALNGLAMIYHTTGDLARAEPLYRQAMDRLRNLLGERHGDYATAVFHLAVLCEQNGDGTQAERLYRQVIEIRGNVLGKEHTAFGSSLDRLAALYAAKGDYSQCEALFRQSLEIHRKAFGEDHPDYAIILVRICQYYRLIGRYTDAEPLIRRSVDICKKALGTQHPHCSRPLHELALLLIAQGKPAEAETHARDAVQLARRSQDLTAGVLSERQQLAMSGLNRSYLDTYLSTAIAANDSGDRIYREILSWKGAVLYQQQFQRVRRRAAFGDQSRQSVQLFAELEQKTRELASAIRLVPTAEQAQTHQRKLAELSEQIERLQRNLAASNTDFGRGVSAAKQTGDDLRQLLPSGVVLIDLIEHTYSGLPTTGEGKPKQERRLAAFLLRPDRPIGWVDLGSADTISAAVDKWRENFGAENAGAENPGTELRRLVWDPLAELTAGCHTILISPDGALGRFPWAALPGKDPDTYLIENVAIATVPVSQMLGELLGSQEQPAPSESSLLLVGNVDFGAAPGQTASDQIAQTRSAPRGVGNTKRAVWTKLPGTLREVKTVGALFEQAFANGKTTPLSQGEATEERFRASAPKNRYLHLATHGFFSPPEVKSALPNDPTKSERLSGITTEQDVVGFHPGLLSGIVLAGANQEVKSDRDDGILTALEVAELDLSRADLVALSACETGLGQSAGGEGLLGLQRALQVAGARSVVASLWQVNDEATRALMTDFYANLWTKKLSKIEALRQAQLKMLRRSRTELPDVWRGLDKVELESADRTGRLPPYYWAAFVLSGDWR